MTDADKLVVVPLCYRRVTAVRKKRSISIPPEPDAEIAAAAQDAGMSYSAWITQTARKEFTIRAGLGAVSQYEAEHGPFTPARHDPPASARRLLSGGSDDDGSDDRAVDSGRAEAHPRWVTCRSWIPVRLHPG